VLTSVHAFAVDPKRGVAVLVLFALALGTGFGLYAWRAPSLVKPSGFTPFSREGALVWNNLGLSVACGTVLVGTLYPLLAQAAGGGLLSVGPPFFNLTFAPLMALILIALPFGPLLAWRKGDLKAAMRTLWFAAVAAIGAGVGVIILARGRLWTALGLALGAWLIFGAGAYLWKRLRGARLSALPLTVWAMSLAHLGVGFFVIGAVAETAFKSERAAIMAPGDSLEFAGRTIRLIDVTDVDGPNYEANAARFDAGGTIMEAERRFYPVSEQTTTEVAILPQWGGDLYIALGDETREGAGWSVRLYMNPLVRFIYFGAGLMALGGVLALARLALRRAAPAKQEATTPAPMPIDVQP
jgi:cytochrome c-type biogenesis protein CcmF